MAKRLLDSLDGRAWRCQSTGHAMGYQAIGFPAKGTPENVALPAAAAAIRMLIRLRNPRMKTVPCCLVLLAWLLAMPASALAAESYDNCTGFVDSVPATISTQGTWCLRGDMATGISTGAAITIGTNNVTLDCNHFKVGGLNGGTGTTASGILASNKHNATIRNCNIRGFLLGIYLPDGGGHLAQNNSLDGNTWAGIYVDAAGSTIRGNRVVDTGLSTVIAHQAIGIYAGSGVDIIDNTVDGVAPGAADASALGIYTQSNGDGSVSGNRIRGVSASGTGSGYGIYNANSGRTIIRGNIVQGPASMGIECSSKMAFARDNVISGFAIAVAECFSAGNIFNAN